uniref:Dynein attachment factor N-terminal domain-containing protein n=1 Tax=Echeneis naucrates TaxID=173247 RepID=A0A665WPI3_ECHNA
LERRDVIDFPALERELQMAVESERRYQRQNEAKLRAVSQRVASYREFRDLVVSCHLKPLEKNDKDGAQRKQPWNPVPTSFPEYKNCSRSFLVFLSGGFQNLHEPTDVALTQSEQQGELKTKSCPDSEIGNIADVSS